MRPELLELDYVLWFAEPAIVLIAAFVVVFLKARFH